MKIDQIFINESENIKNRIENLPVENCITNYFEYLETSAEGFEKAYIKKLSDRAKKFIEKIEMINLKDKTIDEVRKMYVKMVWDGFYGFCEKPWNEIADDYIYYYGSEKLYKYIKQEMKEALEELLDEMNTSRKDHKIAELRNKIEFRQNELNTIDRETEQKKVQLSKEISKLKEQLEEIQSC